ncbi:hypothetical protein AKO1_004186, partial [Acrasis kona]
VLLTCVVESSKELVSFIKSNENGLPEDVIKIITTNYRLIKQRIKRRRVEEGDKQANTFLKFKPSQKHLSNYSWFYYVQDFDILHELCNIEAYVRYAKMIDCFTLIENSIVDCHSNYRHLRQLCHSLLLFCRPMITRYRQTISELFDRYSYMTKRFEHSFGHVQDLYWCIIVLEILMDHWRKFKYEYIVDEECEDVMFLCCKSVENTINK